jgi:hypothetical protein
VNDDELDQPEEIGYDLVFPFVVCQSQGGPYEDEAFVAGYQAGQIDKALAAVAAGEGTEAKFTVRSGLVPQLELIAMNRGFPVMVAEPWEQHPEEWTFVTFSTEKISPGSSSE